MEDLNLEEKKLDFTESIQSYLSETAKWSKFIAIVGYIGMAFIAFFGLFFLFGNLPMDQFNQQPLMNFPSKFLGFIYLIMAVVYYFPTTFLFKFSTRIREALDSSDGEQLEDGFYNLKRLSVFIGVLTIIALAMYAVLLLIMIPTLIFMVH